MISSIQLRLKVPKPTNQKKPKTSDRQEDEGLSIKIDQVGPPGVILYLILNTYVDVVNTRLKKPYSLHCIVIS